MFLFSSIILCQITSKNVHDDLSILIDTNDIENGALNDISNIRPDKLFTAGEKIILYKIGDLNKTKVDEVIDTIVRMFREK